MASMLCDYMYCASRVLDAEVLILSIRFSFISVKRCLQRSNVRIPWLPRGPRFGRRWQPRTVVNV